MDRNNINQETLPLFIRDYAEAMIEALQERFSNSDLYNALSIFDVKLFPKTERQIATYGQKEIEFLGNYYGDSKVVDRNIFTGIIDKEKLLEEWNSAKFYLESYLERDYNFVEIWRHIFDVDNNFINNYPNISLLVEIALIVPLSNATVKRIFSHQNLIKTKL